MAGYFDNVDRLVEEATKLSGQAPGVYVTLNPLNPEVLARRVNRVQQYAKNTAEDADVFRRRWFSLDFDPIRPAGVSSTPEEHQAALDTVRKCRDWLQERGLPRPILADSGNGAHLLVRIDLPNDQESTELVRRCLEAVAIRFTDDTVHVDVKVFNAARVWKLYGTLAAKGDSTSKRPHRLAKLLDVPIEVVAASREQLESLAAMARPRPISASTNSSSNGFELDRWIEKHNLEVEGPLPWNGGNKWIFRRCPWNPEHINRSAYVVQLANGAIAAGCHHSSCEHNDWHALRDLIEPGWRETSHGPEKKLSQATRLVRLAKQSNVELFGSDKQEAFVTLQKGDHRETWPLRSKPIRNWLAYQFFLAEGRTPGTQAIQYAINFLEGEALFEGATMPVYVRVGAYGEAIYVDLANDEWQAVEVDKQGWRIVSDPPVKFRRPNGMLALPTPAPGGTVDELREFVNVRDEDDWTLLLAWLLGAIRPVGPFPTLIFHGEQGSAKSTTAEVLRKLVDPNAAPLRAEPRDVRDLMVSVSHSWVPSFDNLSTLPGWLSDAVCRLATGGGFATRQLYTDHDEMIFDAMRPIIMTGIEELVTRGDLLDRSVIVYLPAIVEEKRAPLARFRKRFEEVRPRILGALLDAVSLGLQNLPLMTPKKLPRMADFALWVAAGAPALGFTSDSFQRAYDRHRREANELALDVSPLSPYVREVAEDQFAGTATDLLAKLDTPAPDKVQSRRDWPKNARSLSGKLRRLAPNLREVGVSVEFAQTQGAASKRIIEIRITPGFCDACDAPDASASQSVDASQNPVLFLKSSSEELQSSAPPQIPRLRPMAVTPRRPSTLVTPAGRLACGVTRAATSSVGTVIPLPLRTT